MHRIKRKKLKKANRMRKMKKVQKNENKKNKVKYKAKDVRDYNEIIIRYTSIFTKVSLTQDLKMRAT